MLMECNCRALYEDIESKTSGNSDDDGWTLVLPSG